jgi:hypothetical protein
VHGAVDRAEAPYPDLRLDAVLADRSAWREIRIGARQRGVWRERVSVRRASDDAVRMLGSARRACRHEEARESVHGEPVAAQTPSVANRPSSGGRAPRAPASWRASVSAALRGPSLEARPRSPVSCAALRPRGGRHDRRSADDQGRLVHAARRAHGDRPVHLSSLRSGCDGSPPAAVVRRRLFRCSSGHVMSIAGLGRSNNTTSVTRARGRATRPTRWGASRTRA